MKPLIEVEEVKKYYKQTHRQLWGKDSLIKAVNGISFSLYEGETFGLVGESGSGKTTTGQLLVQLLKQTEGKIRFKGKDVSKFSAKQLKAWRKEVQIVFQDPYSSLNPKKTVQWILHEPLALHKLGDKSSRYKKMLQTLSDVGLDKSYLSRYPHELSGGQRQRIAIAAALILEPQFIVIDEGVSALDVSVQAQILNLLKDLQQQYLLTYFFISHDLNVVQYFCDRIAVMYLGEIVELGKTADIIKAREHPYSEALFSALPTIENSFAVMQIQGEISDASQFLEGCAFQARCPYVYELCKREKPVVQKINDGHLVACHRIQKRKEEERVLS
ncbi:MULTISPECIES: ABC transporter ATP-binding protein [Clostridia]|uniref:ABC transporter ATP-binding protein n=1 Tax=Clostridia TaxID=186801 RepID=UPI000E9FFC12|nr:MULTISPECIES: ABC transporter ATP-binding protein [Clostridia]NBJ68231.1 ABC transporter ATP-binding protein [Roseburia sp. 1XD42-34]RKI81998.1 ABC transporter ATP-binding protein [Clostridium sp. 1xD42-85]